MRADVTKMLLQWSEGDEKAFRQLSAVLYDELKHLARARMRRERKGHTFSTTGLVHEAYLRLIDVNRVQWKDRSHFLSMASRTMRRVLIDHARAKKAQKRDGRLRRIPLREEMLASDVDVETLLELDDALQRLEAAHPRRGKAAELRYFAGLTLEETADVLDVSPSTVMRDVRFAEAWLARAWGERLKDP